MSVGAAPDRRSIPRTDALLADDRLVDAQRRLGREVVRDAVRAAQDLARTGKIGADEVAGTALARLPRHASAMRPTVNATGVILHTNLGRAALSAAALDAVAMAAGPVDVEFDLDDGRRAPRGRTTVDALLATVPEAQAGHVVNNGAAALLLVVTVLAAGREIIISRGEMVEIGDGFRISELVESTGARLREVGTTNRTRLADYERAIGADTGLVLKVHPSNFRIEGFTRDVPISELATLGVPVVGDLGSGLLKPEPLLPDEPDATTWLRQGATVVTASGDKLLGGPQAGLILGDSAVVVACRRHPIARALRTDKVTLAALEASVRGPDTPTRTALHTPAEQLRERAERLRAQLPGGVEIEVVESEGAVGGGGAAGHRLPGWALRVPERYAGPLRSGHPSVVGRVEHGHCLLNLRSVPAEHDDLIRQALAAVVAGASR